MLHGFNVTELANEVQLNLPQPTSSIQAPQGQEEQSLSECKGTNSKFTYLITLKGSPSFSGQHKQDGLSLDNQVSYRRVFKPPFLEEVR
jgi:hypothetical protein